jgi:asparagine synthase (glutamine-hydrolysing)
MFAFAIWDRRRQRLLLARDRLGIKPLYYACSERELLFASEITAIVEARGERPALNHRVVPELLATRFVSGDETLFRGVQKLLPGRTITWALDGFRTRRYWSLPLPPPDRHTTFDEEARGVRERLTACVQSHLMSDVPLGVFLSGGLDSSGLAALAAPMVREPLRTFAVGFDDPDANELQYARLAANAVGAEHREVIVSPQEYFAALPRLVWHESEPIAFPSSVPLYFVSRLARDHVKVVLTGEGADELFLGYNRYRVTAWNERFARVYGHVMPRSVRESTSRLIAALPRPVRRYATRSFLALGSDARSLFFENFAVFGDAARRALLRDRGVASPDPYAIGLRCYSQTAGSVLDRMSAADLQTYLVELLMKQDQMSMAASIESRVPFLDHQLVEFAATLPDRWKLSGWTTKRVLRESMKGLLPASILNRPKMGFPVPFAQWTRGPWNDMVRDVLLDRRSRERGLIDPDAVDRLLRQHADGRTEGGDRIWSLLNLELWHRTFIDKEGVQTLPHAHPVAEIGSAAAA